MCIAEIRRDIIIDTDTGGDPDDTLVIIQACALDTVVAFVTSDETPDGARARFVQRIVQEEGRDIPVFAGLPSPNPGKHLLGRFAVDTLPQSPSITDGFADLLQNPETLHWVGVGSFTNLAWAGSHFNLKGMRVTAMGGRLGDDPVTRPEHNVKVDPVAAVTVAELFEDITFVPSTVTMSEAMAVDSSHYVLRLLEAKGAQAALMNFEVWFKEKYTTSYQHDLATLAFACGAAGGAVRNARLGTDGRFVYDKDATSRVVSGQFDYQRVWQWFYATHDKKIE